MRRPTEAGPWASRATSRRPARRRWTGRRPGGCRRPSRQRLEAIDAWPGVGRALRSAVATAPRGCPGPGGWPLAAAWLADGAHRWHARALPVSPPADVAVNALLGIAEPEVAAAEARALVESGFGCLKLKGGAEEPGRPGRRVAAVRESVGPWRRCASTSTARLDEASGDRRSLVDLAAVSTSSTWSSPSRRRPASTALARLRRARGDAHRGRRGRHRPGGGRALAAAGAVDVLVVKPARVGGPARGRAHRRPGGRRRTCA